MNTNDSMIDENEIRDALSFLRIDRDAFGRGVRQRVKQTVARTANADDANLKDRGGLLRIAGSVLPVNLLGANTTVAPTSFATVGGFQKAIAFLAFPAISFLMIAVTIGSWLRIKAAQKSQSLPEADMNQIEESVTGWWRRYGWIAAIIFVLTLLAPFYGWTTPLLFMFMASAIGTASIIATLGRAGLVDRNVIGGYCIAMLGILGQVSGSFAISNKSQLLDPHLVTATLFAGAAFLFFFDDSFAQLSGRDAKPKETKANVFLFRTGFNCLLALILVWLIVPKPLSMFFAIIAIGLAAMFIRWGFNRWPVAPIVVRGMFFVLFAGVTAFFGQSLWRPVRTSALVQYAETFEPKLAGYWSHWQATDRWLQDQGIDYDHSAVQARWQLDALDGDEKRVYLLNHVVSTGLMLPPEVTESEDFKAKAQRLLSVDSAGTQISRVKQLEYIIAALAEEGALTNEQRDHLAGRLLATWRAPSDGRLVDATTITNLLSLLDRPLAEAERKADVKRWLGEYQVITSRRSTPSGGFKRYSTVDHSNLMTTEHAVRLMQHYGTHDSVDVLALRAFLRPAWSDRLMMITASVKATTRQRLDQIPGIPQPSLWDYFRLHQSLWFAMLLVGLCIYATLGSPQILRESADPK